MSSILTKNLSTSVPFEDQMTSLGFEFNWVAGAGTDYYKKRVGPMEIFICAQDCSHNKWLYFVQHLPSHTSSIMRVWVSWDELVSYVLQAYHIKLKF